jgi:NADPH2:quinone reductase
VRAVCIEEFGGPEVLRVVDLPAPEPGPGEVLIEVVAAGVNFADTHTRTNTYLAPAALPLIPGGEVVGTRADTGARVAALASSGGYAELAVAPEALTFPVPDGIDDAAALALLIQGVTAWHLLHTSARLASGESVVVHAAAGGVGSLAVQLACLAGAGRIIGTASSEEKRGLALSLGADSVIDDRSAGLTAALVAANDGRKVDVVLEMIGGQVLLDSLAALARFGRLVTFGGASGQPSLIPAAALMRGSRTVVGFWLVDFLRRPETVAGPFAELVELVVTGRLRLVTGETYGLSDVARAHAALESRSTVGKLVLDPRR